ncbi:MAG: hypothetical protein AAFR87_34505 [Bacteroidota bacterium]
MIKIIITLFMIPVEFLKRDPFTYVAAPNEILKWTTADGIMKIGHALPSVFLSGYIALSLMPKISAEYAARLAMNKPVVPTTWLLSLIPFLILNGFIIEWYLEKYHKGYMEAKAEAKANR